MTPRFRTRIACIPSSSQHFMFSLHRELLYSIEENACAVLNAVSTTVHATWGSPKTVCHGRLTKEVVALSRNSWKPLCEGDVFRGGVCHEKTHTGIKSQTFVSVSDVESVGGESFVSLTLADSRQTQHGCMRVFPVVGLANTKRL